MKNKIRSEIEQYFALKSGDGAYYITSAGEDFPAWAFRQGTEYGVLILYDGDDISESFSGATIRSQVVSIDDSNNKNALILSCREKELRNEFSLVCEDFVSPGVNGVARKRILNDPIQWWGRWRALLGDAVRDKMVYDIVGELAAVLKLFQLGEKPYWSASKLSSHDIELDNKSYEVKSTLKKDTSQVHISSQFQFKSEKPLFLVFTRLEESLAGKSIDDLIEELRQYDTGRIGEYNRYLEEHGFESGNHFRKIRYSILERNLYRIDERFPRITEDMFKGDKFPNGITHIEYDISLEGIPYENWE